MASGMCASTVLLMALVPAGGHIVTTTDCYRKTRIFIETMLPKMGITVYDASTHHGDFIIYWDWQRERGVVVIMEFLRYHFLKLAKRYLNCLKRKSEYFLFFC